MRNLSDMGGIYLLGRQKGTVIAENVIYDVSGVETRIFICNNKKFTLDEVQKMGLETGTVLKNPEINYFNNGDLYHEIYKY